jgi:uncharacterized protein YegL
MSEIKTITSNPTAIHKTATITDQYENNIVWGSVDPNAGEIVLYPNTESKSIEEHYERKVPSINLNVFGGIEIHFNNGKPYQNTINGHRSVFRYQLPEGDTQFTKIVEHNALYNAWYLSETKTTHIGFLVDRSGSMTRMYTSVVEEGLSEFVNEQKKEPHEVKFYGSTFSDELTHLFNGIDLKTETTILEEFNKINPSGSTAYYDAVCDMIDCIRKNYTINDEVIIVSASDGADNASKRHTIQTMKRAIQKKKRLGWKFAMIGTNNLDAEQLSQEYGIGRGASLNTDSTRGSMQAAFRGLSAGVQRTRVGESADIVFTDTERNNSAR